MGFVTAVASVFPWLMSIGMIIGPVSPYVPQYLETRRTGIAGGFSPMVAFLLVVSSIGRVFYWILLRFDNTLLWQAVVMIVAQLVLLKQQVTLMAASGRRSSLWEFDMRSFWQWTVFSDYIVVLVSLTFVLSLVVYMLRGSATLAVAIGYISLFAESSISVPQFVANCKRGTTVGLSAIMIAMWFGGDCYKLVYFVVVPVPASFLVCAVVQSIVDFGISCQIVRTKCRERGRCGGPRVRHRRLKSVDADSDSGDEGTQIQTTESNSGSGGSGGGTSGAAGGTATGAGTTTGAAKRKRHGSSSFDGAGDSTVVEMVTTAASSSTAATVVSTPAAATRVDMRTTPRPRSLDAALSLSVTK